MIPICPYCTESVTYVSERVLPIYPVYTFAWEGKFTEKTGGTVETHPVPPVFSGPYHQNAMKGMRHLVLVSNYPSIIAHMFLFCKGDIDR
jgi:hypothetical protein